MKNLLYCRRTFLATLGILCLTGIAYTKGIDVSMAIATIVAAVAGANSFEKSIIAKAEAGISNVLRSDK